MEQKFTEIPQPKEESPRAAPGHKPGGTLNPSLKSAPPMPNFGSRKRKRQRRITKILIVIAFILALIGMGFAVAGIVTGGRKRHAAPPAAGSPYFSGGGLYRQDDQDNQGARCRFTKTP